MEDISDSDCFALASKTAIFDLADCRSACATCTAASLRTGPLGGVWLSLGDACLFRLPAYAYTQLQSHPLLGQQFCSPVQHPSFP